jgi:hypothetical protein
MENLHTMSADDKSKTKCPLACTLHAMMQHCLPALRGAASADDMPGVMV